MLERETTWVWCTWRFENSKRSRWNFHQMFQRICQSWGWHNSLSYTWDHPSGFHIQSPKRSGFGSFFFWKGWILVFFRPHPAEDGGYVPQPQPKDRWNSNPMEFQFREFHPGQIIIFHQPRFPWNKGISLTFHHHLGILVVFEVAIIWPDSYVLFDGTSRRSLNLIQHANSSTLERDLKMFENKLGSLHCEFHPVGEVGDEKSDFVHIQF